ncbi:MAG: competence protein CoiA family protein [Spirosomataceae bacterium]
MEDNIDVENEHLKDKDFDARQSRCYGLVEKIAVRKSDNKKVSAQYVLKENGPFYCPACLSEAIVRKCGQTDRSDHFAHKARQSPVLKSKDLVLHKKCLDQILSYLQQTFSDGKWEAERPITFEKNKKQKEIVPDISGRINSVPVAIEVQKSAYTLKRIADKLADYKKCADNLAVLYIIPLYEELGNEPFRPRLFEKYLHTIYKGRVYYWSEKTGLAIQAVHFSPAKRWIEESTWYDSEMMEERTTGGFFLTYRTVKMPNYGPILDIAKDFIKDLRPDINPKMLKFLFQNVLSIVTDTESGGTARKERT